MKRMNKKFIVLVSTIMVLSLSFASIAFAAGQYKNVKAWFGDIKIYRNQQPVSFEGTPFILDGTTYVPLRAMSNLFDKEVGWDGTNYKISIDDRPDLNMTYMMQTLATKEVEINTLKAKVTALEAELKTKKETSTNVSTLSELETYLKKQHRDYKNINFDINLSGSTSYVKVKIYIDSSDYTNRWTSLSTTNKESYVQDIIDDILREFKNADVSGYIENKSTNRNLLSFSMSSRGKVIIDSEDKYNDNKYISDLENQLSNTFYRTYNLYPSFKLSEYGNAVDVTITVDSSYWNLLTSAEMKKFTDDVYYDVSRWYNTNISINISVIDTRGYKLY